MSIEISFPTGRIVYGHPTQPQKVKDDNTGAVKLKEDGTERLRWTFGVAVPKADCKPIFDEMKKAAAELFPSGVPQSFAWKYKDGDKGVDAKGNPLKDKPGWAGCYVFALSTELQAPPVNVYNFATKKWEAGAVKRGDFVQVIVDCKAQKPTDPKAKPGLYLNPKVVALYAIGEEIKGGEIDANERFAPPPQQTPTDAPPGSAAAPPQSEAPKSAAPHSSFPDGPGAPGDGDDEIPF